MLKPRAHHLSMASHTAWSSRYFLLAPRNNSFRERYVYPTCSLSTAIVMALSPATQAGVVGVPRRVSSRRHDITSDIQTSKRRRQKIRLTRCAQRVIWVLYKLVRINRDQTVTYQFGNPIKANRTNVPISQIHCKDILSLDNDDTNQLSAILAVGSFKSWILFLTTYRHFWHNSISCAAWLGLTR